MREQTNDDRDPYAVRPDGKPAIVTGALRGIGLTVAEALTGAGADIVAVSTGLEPSGSEAEKRVTALWRTCTALRADFADRTAVSRLASHLGELGRPVDRDHRPGPAAEHSGDDWDHVLSVNPTSQFTLTREVGRRMLVRRQGKGAFTASLLSFQGSLDVPGFTAAKSGIAGLTRALANEWAGRGVNVHGIVPGYVATDNTQALRDDPTRCTRSLDRIPARHWADPADIGGAVEFLASPASDHVHAALIPVDGGWLGR